MSVDSESQTPAQKISESIWIATDQPSTDAGPSKLGPVRCWCRGEIVRNAVLDKTFNKGYWGFSKKFKFSINGALIDIQAEKKVTKC